MRLFATQSANGIFPRGFDGDRRGVLLHRINKIFFQRSVLKQPLADIKMVKSKLTVFESDSLYCILEGISRFVDVKVGVQQCANANVLE